MRLSDAERDEAINTLSEHVRTGRLDLDEYGTRSAKVTAAKTRGDLAPLFADLPEPHPSVLVTTGVQPAPSRPSPVARFGGRALVPIAGLIALLLLFTVARGMWWLVFLLPAVVLMVAGRKR
jgi:uncharacterized protein DUF1707